MEKQIEKLVSESKTIVIIQADNPDMDSLTSALALEQILGDAGNDVKLYCGVEMPSYMRWMTGWSRVQTELPSNFDLSIIVDTSAINLLEQLEKTGSINWLKTKPCIVIDHHTEAEHTIDFATINYIKSAVSTGELIYWLSQEIGWKRSLETNEAIAASILSDSMGLTSESATAKSILTLSKVVEEGVSLAKLDNLRRQSQKKSQRILAYKGQLLQRVEYSNDSKIAHVTIPWKEIEEYSPEYNPSILAIDEMRQVENVRIAISFKVYPDGKITGKIRANYGSPVANKIASNFGGGGHPYAAGFKVNDSRKIDEIKSECLDIASKLIEDIEHETVQHS